MSELLDNQVNTQNENLKIKVPGFTQALIKRAMKIKIEEKDCRAKRIIGVIYKAISETGWVNFDELRVTESTSNEGTNSLVNRGRKDGLLCVIAQQARHKTRNGWYSGMVAPIYFIVGVLILYSKNVLGL